MKKPYTLLFLACAFSSYSSGQDLSPVKPVKVVPQKAKTTEVPVVFIPNDTCNLRINGSDFGEIPKNSLKTIWLPLGYHRLFFESLETGETIKKRYFQLHRDSLRDGKYTYQVTFKQEN
jgi:hypothetical protein